jgi:hypothetical protein
MGTGDIKKFNPNEENEVKNDSKVLIISHNGEHNGKAAEWVKDFRNIENVEFIEGGLSQICLLRVLMRYLFTAGLEI